MISEEKRPSETDYLIIGSGPGGDGAANRLAELGQKRIVVVDKGPIGGTCVNWGCIPTHFILENLLLQQRISEANTRYHLFNSIPAIELDALKSAKERVIQSLQLSIMQSFEKNGIEFINGTARILGHREVEITKEDGAVIKMRPGTIIVATGAPFTGLSVPGMKEVKAHLIRADRVMALDFKEVPKSVAVYGLDSPAVELASFYHLMGSQVSLLSPQISILSYGSAELGETVEDSIEFHDIEVYRDVKLEEFRKKQDRLIISFKERGENRLIECDVLVDAYRRQSNLECIQDLSIDTEDGRPLVNETFQSSAEGIYFLGDVRSGGIVPFRSHLAAFSGRVLAEKIMGEHQGSGVDLTMILRGMATIDFQIARIGLTEADAVERDLDVKTLRIPNSYNAYAHILGQVAGYAQLVVETETGRILGGEIVSPDAINLITVIGTAMACDGTIHDLKKYPGFHPSLAEAILECAWL